MTGRRSCSRPYRAVASVRARVEAVEVDTGKRQVLIEGREVPAPYVQRTSRVLPRGGLHAVPFDAGRLIVTGPPIEVTAAVEQDSSGAPLAEISSVGLTRLPTCGRGIGAARVGLASRHRATRHRCPPRISVPASVGRQPSHRRRRRGRPLGPRHASFEFTRLTSQQSETASYPIWTPDGKQIVFRTPTGLRSIETDGSGRSQAIAGTTSGDFPSSVSRTAQQWRQHDARLMAPPTFTCFRSPASRPRGARHGSSLRGWPAVFARWPLDSLRVERVRSVSGVSPPVSRSRGTLDGVN